MIQCLLIQFTITESDILRKIRIRPKSERERYLEKKIISIEKEYTLEEKNINS